MLSRRLYHLAAQPLLLELVGAGSSPPLIQFPFSAVPPPHPNSEAPMIYRTLVPIFLGTLLYSSAASAEKVRGKRPVATENAHKPAAKHKARKSPTNKQRPVARTKNARARAAAGGTATAQTPWYERELTKAPRKQRRSKAKKPTFRIKSRALRGLRQRRASTPRVAD